MNCYFRGKRSRLSPLYHSATLVPKYFLLKHSELQQRLFSDLLFYSACLLIFADYSEIIVVVRLNICCTCGDCWLYFILSTLIIYHQGSYNEVSLQAFYVYT